MQTGPEQGYLGPKPHLRFLETTWSGYPDDQLYNISMRAPTGGSAEATIRWMMQKLPLKQTTSVQSALDRIHQKWEAEGPFECILGHSEGAQMAANFTIDHFNRCKASGAQPYLQSAIFINGVVPYAPDGADLLLADSYGQVIEIPTCHILAWNDALVFESVALYNLCREESATIVDHGRGHSIPQDQRSCKLMAKGIGDLFNHVSDVKANNERVDPSRDTR